MRSQPQTIQFMLIRHGESEANAGGTVGGNTVSLTDEGRRQSTLLGEYLTQKGHTFDAAWYSTLPRAIQTFEEITQVLPKSQIARKRIFDDERIIERQHGKWEGRTSAETWTPTEMARMAQLGADYATPGGESFRDVTRRMDLWLQDALKAGRMLDKALVHFLVVSHGHALRCLLAPLFELDARTYWRIAIDNTSITKIRWVDEKGWFLDCLNSRPHLGLLAQISHLCFGGFFV